MLRIIIPSIVACIILTSCQNTTEPREAASNNTSTQTNNLSQLGFPSIPSEASSQEGIRSDETWKNYLVQPGDVPENQKGGENLIIASPHPLTTNFPGLRVMVTQWIDLIEQDGEIGGEATLYVYETVEAANQGYSKASPTLYEPEKVEALGERAQLWHHENTTQVVFQRCQVVLKVKGTWQIDPSTPRGFFRKEDVIAYAQRLDERITTTACK